MQFLNLVSIPQLTEDQSKDCEFILSQKDYIIFLYSAYVHDATIFLSDEDSVIEVMNGFDKFSLVSGINTNKAKCEIAGIGVLKGESLALCGMDCIDQKNNKNFRNTFFL